MAHMKQDFVNDTPGEGPAKVEAVVCWRDRVTDMGPGQEWFVRLPDGYLLECGIEEARAQRLARAINHSTGVNWTTP